MESQDIKIESEVIDFQTADEANNLLRNGILVETSKGLVCMSLNDALSSDLNLSADDLRNVAAKLISQQDICDKPSLLHSNIDSDGFSSECSDISTSTTSSGVSSALITFTSLTNDAFNKNKLHNEGQVKIVNKPKSSSSSKISEKCDLNEINKIENTCTIVDKSIYRPGNFNSLLDTTAAEIPVKQKARGGWPKGRKRKPELLNLPPKAPATGYTFYLNEQRKNYKDSNLAFHEITKIIGNRWTSLGLEQKKIYLEKAEEDKKRYRNELKVYRKSDAYRSYLAKRKNRLQKNILSDNDMDATDEMEEDDSEELYCRRCDQWFHNLHNKREHLQGKQHIKSVAGDINGELESDVDPAITNSIFITSLDESGVDNSTGGTLYHAMANLVNIVKKRDNEIKSLQKQQEVLVLKQQSLCRQLLSLNVKYKKIKKRLSTLQEKEKEMENGVFPLKQVPNWFIITDFNSEDPSPVFADGTT